MKLKLLSLLILLSLTGCGEEETAPPTENKEKTSYSHKIIAFGNSLTEGYGLSKSEAYPAQLQEKLHQEGYETYEVINAGISGETSTGSLLRVDFILSQDPDIVIFESGANDALRGIDLALTRKNIDDAISQLQKGGTLVILAGMQMTENLGAHVTEPFRKMYPELAKKYNTPLIPFLLEGVAAVPELNLRDGIHPTAEGYGVVVERNVWPAVEGVIKN